MSAPRPEWRPWRDRTERPPERHGPMPVPALLHDAAGWAWRLIIVGGAVYGLFWLLEKLYLVVLPFIGALLIVTLIHPLSDWLRRRGLGRATSTWLTILIGFLVLGGVFFFIADQIASQYPALVDQFGRVIRQGRNLLVDRLGLSPTRINQLENQLLQELQRHRGSVASGVLTGVTILGEAVTGAILAFFTGFFLLYDGARIWGWVTHLFPGPARPRVRAAGHEAWTRIAGYVRGTFLIGCFHGVVIAIALTGLGAPLVGPLALLVFFGSFIPIIGAFVFGGLAVLVTLVTQGLISAVILVAVLVLQNQAEAHLLQPFLVGRYVRLHPLAVVLAITAGGLLKGLFGAILALPVVSAVYAVAQVLAASRAGRYGVTAQTDPDPPDDEGGGNGEDEKVGR